MRILLVGINAKYIHSNIGIYSLRAYAKKYAYAFCNGNSSEIELSEYTINQQKSDIVKDIYSKHCDVICFSCYIWNIDMVRNVIEDISAIMPKAHIWLGGPEVSYELDRVFDSIPYIKGVMVGEGEETFKQLVDIYEECQLTGNYDMRLKALKGIAYIKEGASDYHFNGYADLVDFAKVPFPYTDIKDFKNRIVYYESSRGCPYSCSYCLSSVDKKLRFRTMQQIKEELAFFINADVPQVKFIDRTFNCDHKRSIEILSFIKEHDNGHINYHFEIAGDILTDDEIEIIRSLRPGLIQLEIGVQSTNEDTLKAINRITDMNKLRANISKLREARNVHLHLDLIAGLPYENLESFKKSFNDVYAMKGDELQLGFLKMLRGAPITQAAKDHNIVTSKGAPYEVLSTKYLSYDDVIELKNVEEMLEIYHNSNQFCKTEQYFLAREESPYDFYYNLAKFYEKQDFSVMQSARTRRYEILLSYGAYKGYSIDENMHLKELLTLDYYLRENAKARPAFSTDESKYLALKKEFYKNKDNITKYLPEYLQYDSKQIGRMTHLEMFSYIEKDVLYLFDYKKIDPISHSALVQKIPI